MDITNSKFAAAVEVKAEIGVEVKVEAFDFSTFLHIPK